uniref:Receptor ligand binding region domain-containing protein n=1 Tax=Acrobeloides nanus TaxID=290746 RepID=A0A914EMD4_9BILA
MTSYMKTIQTYFMPLFGFENFSQNLYNVIVGSPSCINGDELEGDVATFYNVNLILWGATTHSVFLGPYYPTVLGAIDTYRDSAKALQMMMITFSWDMFSLIYTQEESCTYFVEELDVIVVLCMEDMNIYRNFADAAHKAGMDTDEYVYILRTTVKRLAELETNPIYGNDPSAKLFSSKTFLLTIDNGNSDITTFDAKVMERMADPPFNCSACKNMYQASDYAPTLHDTIYLYAYALSNAINKSGNSDVVHNGTYVAADNNFNAVTGINGNIKLGRDGFRKANYLISSYND